MAANVVLKWSPARLDAALLTAFRRSLPVAKADAVSHSPAGKKAGAKVVGVNTGSLATARATLAPTGIGTVFEVGRHGGYPIVPGGAKGLRATSGKTFDVTDQFGRTYRARTKRGGTAKALKFTGGNGGFAAYAVGGAMRAEPYIKPAGARWVSTHYKAAARATLAANGFGGRL